MTGRDFVEHYLKVRSCGGCGERMTHERAGRPFCPDCELRWRRAKAESCQGCFRQVTECICMPDLLARTSVGCLRKLVFYRTGRPGETQNQILYRIKRFPNRRYGDFLAAELSPAIEQEWQALTPAVSKEELLFVPIPRSRRSYIRFGHDQSELLCRCLFQRMEIPTADLIGRRWGGREQKRLSGRQRLKNIQGLLYVRKKHRAILQGRIVLLVDDIVTTGATMTAAVRLLEQYGVRRVLCFTVAGHEFQNFSCNLRKTIV